MGHTGKKGGAYRQEQVVGYTGKKGGAHRQEGWSTQARTRGGAHITTRRYLLSVGHQSRIFPMIVLLTYIIVFKIMTVKLTVFCSSNIALFMLYILH